MPDIVSIDDFRKLDLRVAKILEVHEIVGADKLWRLVIDLGGEARQIVAGIKLAYPDRDALVGKLIVVVANLAPAVIRGVESRGMLLAGKDVAGGFALVSPDHAVLSGATVG